MIDPTLWKHDVSKLTTLVADNIMVFHDNADYEGLERNTAAIVRELGYPDDVARKCGHVVKNIYVQYDIAQELHEKGDENEERKHYLEAHSLADQLNIFLDLGYRTNNIINMVYYWRHKQKALAIIAIMRDWVEKLGFRNIPFAAYCTYLQTRAGYNHDKRNKKEFERSVCTLWNTVKLANKQEKLPILF